MDDPAPPVPARGIGLAIAALPHRLPGRLAFSPCPGRDVSVPDAVATIAAEGFDLVLGLVAPSEFPDQARFEAALGALAITTLRLPIDDFQTPAVSAWVDIAPRLHAELDSGRSILVHCLAGRGRSGMIAARLLTERDLEPIAAMAAVRHVRPGAIETAAQEDFVAAGWQAAR